MLKLQGVKPNHKLLTIAIPTYNRASYLDLCLQRLCPQIKGNEEFIDLIISDNASSDATATVVKKYINLGFAIQYSKNDVNIGMDGNFLKCFNTANSKYVWLFSDDDFLLDAGIKKIISILRQDNYGIVYLTGCPYKENPDAEIKKSNQSGYDIYYSKKLFLWRENYFFCYLTGNIVNKTLVNLNIDITPFMGQFLSLVVWELSALANATKNVCVRDTMLAAKIGNTGGYALCKVFGANLERIFKYFTQHGFKNKDFDTIRRKLVFNFFPHFIREARLGVGNRHTAEDYYKELYPVFKTHLWFWLFTYPIIKLPIKLTVIPLKIMQACNYILQAMDIIFIEINVLMGRIAKRRFK